MWGSLSSLSNNIGRSICSLSASLMSTAVESIVDPPYQGHRVDLRDANSNTLYDIQNKDVNTSQDSLKKKRRTSSSRGRNNKKAKSTEQENHPNHTTPCSSPSNNTNSDSDKSPRQALQREIVAKSPPPSTLTTPSPGEKKRNPRSRTFSARKVVKKPHINSDDSCDSDEECYNKSLKDRKPLESAERHEHVEMREKQDQARVNRSFFDKKRHPEWKEQHATYMALIETNLFHPPSPPSGYNSEECETFTESCPTRKFQPPSLAGATSVVEHSSGVPVPGFRLVTPTTPYDMVISRKFYEQYTAGRILVEEPEDHHTTTTTYSPKKDDVITSAITDRKMPLWRRIGELFDPAEWGEAESLLFEELVSIYGTSFADINRILCGSKSVGQFHAYCHSKWGFESILLDNPDVHRRETCHVCFGSDTNKTNPRDRRLSSSSRKNARNNGPQLVVCGACERGYHLNCLSPPLEFVPSSWYCSDDCVVMSQLHCQLCGNKEDDDKMLLCDTCNLGFHIFCLNPPLSSIPEGDWNCPKCTSPPASSSSPTSELLPTIPDTTITSPVATPTSVNHSTPTTPTLQKRSSVALPLPIICKHSSDHFSHAITKVESTSQTTPNVVEAAKRLTSFMTSTPTSGLTIFTLKKLADQCVQCAMASGLLHGDSITSRNVNAIADESSYLADYYVEEDSYFDEPYSKDALTHRFDVILSAVSLATHQLYDTAKGTEDPPIPTEVSVNPEDVPTPAYLALDLLPPTSPSLSTTTPILSLPLTTGTTITTTTTTTTTTTQTITSTTTEVKKRGRKRKIDLAAATSKGKRHSTGSLPDNISSESEDHSTTTSPTISPDATPTLAPAQTTVKRCWVFSFNPRNTDAEAILQPNVRVEWQVRQHADVIKKGDDVYIWSFGKQGGLCGTATVVENPTPASAPAYGSHNKYKAAVRILTTLSRPVSKAQLTDAGLSDLIVLRSPVGTNFRVTPEQAQTLHQVFEDYRDETHEHNKHSTTSFLQLPPPSPLSSSGSVLQASGNLNTSSDEVPNITKECFSCKKLDSSGCLVTCGGCKDSYHHSCVDNPVLSGSWYCMPCTILNEQDCKACGKASLDHELVPCDLCKATYHKGCVTPALTELPISWLCTTCMLTPSELMTSKVALGYREVRAECNRMLRIQCEKAAQAHKRSILHYRKDKSKVLNKMKLMAEDIRELRERVVEIASERFQNWVQKVVQDIPIPPSTTTTIPTPIPTTTTLSTTITTTSSTTSITSTDANQL